MKSAVSTCCLDATTDDDDDDCPADDARPTSTKFLFSLSDEVAFVMAQEKRRSGSAAEDCHIFTSILSMCLRNRSCRQIDRQIGKRG